MEGFHKKNTTNLGFWLKLRDGGVRKGFKVPTLLYGLFSMAKKGFKLIKNVKPNITGPKLRGEGSAEVQPKAQVCPVFF